MNKKRILLFLPLLLVIRCPFLNKNVPSNNSFKGENNEGGTTRKRQISEESIVSENGLEVVDSGLSEDATSDTDSEKEAKSKNNSVISDEAIVVSDEQNDEDLDLDLLSLASKIEGDTHLKQFAKIIKKLSLEEYITKYDSLETRNTVFHLLCSKSLEDYVKLVGDTKYFKNNENIRGQDPFEVIPLNEESLTLFEHFLKSEHSEDLIYFLTKKDSNGNTLLHRAIDASFENLVNLILFSIENSNLDEESKLEIVNSKNNSEKTPLLSLKIKNNQSAILTSLVEFVGVDLYSSDSNGVSLLHNASEVGEESLGIILANMKDESKRQSLMNQSDKRGMLATQISAKKGDIKSLKLYLEYGLQVSVDLIEVCRDDEESFNLLLKSYLNQNPLGNKNGFINIYKIAIAAGNIDMVDLLMKNNYLIDVEVILDEFLAKANEKILKIFLGVDQFKKALNKRGSKVLLKLINDGDLEGIETVLRGNMYFDPLKIVSRNEKADLTVCQLISFKAMECEDTELRSKWVDTTIAMLDRAYEIVNVQSGEKNRVNEFIETICFVREGFAFNKHLVLVIADKTDRNFTSKVLRFIDDKNIESRWGVKDSDPNFTSVEHIRARVSDIHDFNEHHYKNNMREECFNVLDKVKEQKTPFMYMMDLKSFENMRKIINSMTDSIKNINPFISDKNGNNLMHYLLRDREALIEHRGLMNALLSKMKPERFRRSVFALNDEKKSPIGILLNRARGEASTREDIELLYFITNEVIKTGKVALSMEIPENGLYIIEEIVEHDMEEFFKTLIKNTELQYKSTDDAKNAFRGKFESHEKRESLNHNSNIFEDIKISWIYKIMAQGKLSFMTYLLKNCYPEGENRALINIFERAKINLLLLVLKGERLNSGILELLISAVVTCVNSEENIEMPNIIKFVNETLMRIKNGEFIEFEEQIESLREFLDESLGIQNGQDRVEISIDADSDNSGVVDLDESEIVE